MLGFTRRLDLSAHCIMRLCKCTITRVPGLFRNDITACGPPNPPKHTVTVFQRKHDIDLVAGARPQLNQNLRPGFRLKSGSHREIVFAAATWAQARFACGLSPKY